MKSESEIRKQLEEVYQHRFLLRCERRMRKCCRNCRFSVPSSFDLGDFGTRVKYSCGYPGGESECGFECRWTEKEIEDEMISDISNPSVCGAKEPKIAALLWVLHGDFSGGKGDGMTEDSGPSSVPARRPSLWRRLVGILGRGRGDE